VSATDRADGWIVALGDMPLVSPATIRAVRDALVDGALLAAPVARASGARGHPVAFSAALRPELLALDGDVGARGIVERHRDELRILPTEDPGIVIDLDTPAQLSALAAQRRESGRS
jgi:molybdenum cofactor cytidylyltransferase